jgi:hypothetical protein
VAGGEERKWDGVPDEEGSLLVPMVCKCTTASYRIDYRLSHQWRRSLTASCTSLGAFEQRHLCDCAILQRRQLARPQQRPRIALRHRMQP